MSESTIGDYYLRKRKEFEAAYAKWQEAVRVYDGRPTHENEKAMYDAREAMIDAGNTGD